MKKIFTTIVLLATFMQAQTINVAVAANVSYAMDPLLEEFAKTNPNTKVKITLGSSGKLTAQIKHGAPFDIFMSANMKYPEALYSDGVATTSPIVYAQGSLALLSASPKDFTKEIFLLKDTSIKRIAIANPKTAPYGIAAFEALKNANILGEVEHKFVYGESISQTLSYTMTAADIGIIAKSSLYSPKMTHFQKGSHWIEIDSKLYTPINQGIVILKNGSAKGEARAFYEFMLSPKAKQILQDYGYITP